MITEFDNSDIFQCEIEKRMEELKILCNKYRIPMFISMCIKNDKNGSVYKSDMVGTVSNEIYLKDDKIPHYVNVLNGFDTVPPQTDFEIEM